MKRRDFVKFSLAAGAAGVWAPRLIAEENDDLLKFLCLPDGLPPDLLTRPSPKVRPFVAELRVPPVSKPSPVPLHPPPVAKAHQRYNEFLPKKFYEIREQEFLWQYHPDPPYDKGSWSWGFDGTTPGPTYHARYGEPILVRRHNDLPELGQAKVSFAMPRTTSHLHNGHTASESDGFPTPCAHCADGWWCGAWQKKLSPGPAPADHCGGGPESALRSAHDTSVPAWCRRIPTTSFPCHTADQDGIATGIPVPGSRKTF